MCDEGSDCNPQVTLYAQWGILCHTKSLRSVVALCATDMRQVVHSKAQETPPPGTCSCKDRERLIRGGRLGSPGVTSAQPEEGIGMPGANEGYTRALLEEEPGNKARLWQSWCCAKASNRFSGWTTNLPKEHVCQQQKLSFSRGDEAIWGGDSGSRGSLTHSHGRAGCSREPTQCWKWKAFSRCSLTCSSLRYSYFQSFWVWQHYRHCVKGRVSGFAVSVNVKSASHPFAPLASFSAQPRCLHLNSKFCTEPSNEIPVLVSQRYPASRVRSHSALDCKPRDVTRTSQLLHKWGKILYKF